jgi:hypothetical protein
MLISGFGIDKYRTFTDVLALKHLYLFPSVRSGFELKPDPKTKPFPELKHRAIE